jgi:hypothetical protein
MSSGVPGQALEMYFPPAEVQDDVEMQTPGAPPEPVHSPLILERAKRIEVASLAVVKKYRRRRTSAGSILG